MPTVIDGWRLVRGEQWETTDGRLLLSRLKKGGWMVLCQDVNDEMQLLDAGVPTDGEAAFHQVLHLCHQVIGSVLTTRLHFVCYAIEKTPWALTRDIYEKGWTIEADYRELAEPPFLYQQQQWSELLQQLEGPYATRYEALCQLAATGIDRSRLPQLVTVGAINQMP